MKNNAIYVDPEIMGGTPVFRGTRVSIQTFFDYLEGGDSVKVFLDDYPTVSNDLVIEVLKETKRLLTTEFLLSENYS